MQETTPEVSNSVRCSGRSVKSNISTVTNTDSIYAKVNEDTTKPMTPTGPESLGMVSQSSFGKTSERGSIGHNSVGKGSIASACGSRVCSPTGSKNDTLTRNRQKNSNLISSGATPPVSPTSDPQLDLLIMSLAKETLTGVNTKTDNDLNKLEGILHNNILSTIDRYSIVLF